VTGPDRTLVVLLEGQRIGELVEDGNTCAFTYDRAYRSSGVTPLSLSMPLNHRRYGDETVRPFLWGLLPDNEQVIERWARDYQVSPRNPFALLRHVGADCAGAARFVPA
jgi:serine/threonine-protein kinase HipA